MKASGKRKLLEIAQGKVRRAQRREVREVRVRVRGR
jgi:hypothetical protein